MIVLKCDKCGKEIETALYLKNDRVWEKGTCLVKFEFEREKGQRHNMVLDICPDCQEQIIKDILRVLPWVEGK